jgi:DNA-binding transcriptional regulator YdaS (Cro superfamily)
MTPREALEKAIRVLGSQTAVATAAGEGVETGHVYHWLNKAPEVPAKYCPGIEAATRAKGIAADIVYCEQLCPGTKWSVVRAEDGPKPRRKADRATAANHPLRRATDRANATHSER